jgi:hypothetical protein
MMPAGMKKVNPDNQAAGKNHSDAAPDKKVQCRGPAGEGFVQSRQPFRCAQPPYRGNIPFPPVDPACIQHSPFHELIPEILSFAGSNQQAARAPHFFLSLAFFHGNLLYKQGQETILQHFIS